jgi:hypothetical protein
VIRAGVAAFLALAASGASAFDRLGVVAVSDPPSGPDADLAELAHQIRAACRDRIGGVEDVPTMRARLLGQTSNATLSELERAYGGALAVYQNGEFESALRTLHAIVDDLESLPETEDSYAQWTRAQLRLAHAALTIGREAEAEAALYEVARTDLSISPEPELYSPSYRRRYDGIRARVRALPARRLTVTADGSPGTVFVNGRPLGTTPLSLWLPSGVYRIGGQAGDLRVPSFRVDLRPEDRSVVLDFALAESLRVNAGPGLALPVTRRGDGVVRAGAWLGVDKVIAVSRVFEGEAAFLLGSIYDVRRGALLREGSVRMAAGSVPSQNLGALAAFLLTGQSSRDVKDRTDVARVATPPRAPVAAVPEPPPVVVARSAEPSAGAAPTSSKPGAGKAGVAGAKVVGGAPAETATATSPATTVASTSLEILPPSPSPASPGVPNAPVSTGASRPPRDPAPRGAAHWLRPAAIGSGVMAGLLAGFSIQQGLAARSRYADADAMVGPNGALLPGSDAGRYRALRGDGDAAKRNAYVSAGAAVAFAAAAGVLGWKSFPRSPEPAIAFRF